MAFRHHHAELRTRRIHVRPAAEQQQVLPEEYRNASDEELQERIRAAKSRLGKKLLILGHFYQRDEIICHADFVGDSFQLAKNATERPDADHIEFCGVHI